MKVRIDCQRCPGHRMVANRQRNNAKPLCAACRAEDHRLNVLNRWREKMGKPPVELDSKRGMKIMRSNVMPVGAELEPSVVKDFLKSGSFDNGDILEDMRNGQRFVIIESELKLA